MNALPTDSRPIIAQPTVRAEQPPSAAQAVALTRLLLTAGLVAGPIYIIVGALEMLLRPGYDIRRHELSVVANGDWGWIHILMMATTGLLTIAGAVGMRRAIRGQRAGTWGPLLVGLYGLGVGCAGFFTADPTLGFPPGTPADAREVSWHGGLHLVFGSLGFLGLIAATMVFARRFASVRQRGLAAFSVLTGVFFFVSFAGISVGSGAARADPDVLAFTLIAFTLAVVLAWIWLSTVSAELRRSLTDQRVA